MAQTEKNKKEKKSSHVLGKIFFALFFMALGAVGGYYYAQYRNTDLQRCESEWASVAATYDINALRQFVENYPDSEHLKEAKERLNKLMLLQNAWADVCNSSKTSDFIDFINAHPDAFYEKLCHAKIDSLDWDRAQQDATPESVKYYLEVHPEGKYAAEAQLLIEQFNLADSMAESKSDDIRQKLQSLLQAIGSNDTETLLSLLADKIEYFINKEHPTKTEVKDMLQRMYSSHILSCTFDIPSHLKIKLEENGEHPVYSTHFVTRQHIVRDNEGKTEDMYVVDAFLDENLLVLSFRLSKK